MLINPREIWKKGTPLSEAWRTWATDENLRIINAPKNKTNPNQKFTGNLWSELNQIYLDYNKGRDRIKLDENTTKKMKKDIIEWLMEEDLFALGFPVLPTAERTPRLISSEFWMNAEINWEHDIANDEVSKFQRIKIVSLVDFSENTIKPKIGRKSHKGLIIKAIQDLEKSIIGFENYTNKNKINCIWDYLNIHNPELIRDHRGLKDDTLRKIINSHEKNKI